MAKPVIPDEFVPVHVHYGRDKAVRKAGNDGELMFLRSLARARADKTGGRIEDFDLDTIGRGMDDPYEVAARLVSVGLWIAEGDGWHIRSWEKWNPSTSSESGTFGNHKRWHVDRNIVSPDCPYCDSSPRIAPDIAPESPPESGQGIANIAEESRGEKSREEGEEKRVSASQAKRARQLPADWRPTPEAVAKIRAEFPALSLAAEHQKFADHFTANGKPMKDWDAAWRNWMRRASEFSARGNTGRRQQETDDLFAAAFARAAAADRADATQPEIVEGAIL